MLNMSKFLCQQYTTVNKNYNIDYVFKCYKNLLSSLQLYVAILNGLWRRTPFWMYLYKPKIYK